jgi:hypothetical protein
MGFTAVPAAEHPRDIGVGGGVAGRGPDPHLGRR